MSWVRGSWRQPGLCDAGGVRCENLSSKIREYPEPKLNKTECPISRASLRFEKRLHFSINPRKLPIF